MADLEALEHARRLLYRLGPRQLEAVTKLLETMVHPDDDEMLSEEDRRAVTASREYFEKNPDGGIAFEQLVAECGFTMDEIRGKREQ